MRRAICILIITALAGCFTSCGSDDEEESEKLAEFKVVSETTGVTEYGTGYVRFTIENVGVGPGHNVLCRVHAKKDNTILATGIAYFAMSGPIDPGEKAENEVVFLGLTSLAGLTLEYEFEWEED
jgi:hypothetical protein